MSLGNNVTRNIAARRQLSRVIHGLTVGLDCRPIALLLGTGVQVQTADVK